MTAGLLGWFIAGICMLVFVRLWFTINFRRLPVRGRTLLQSASRCECIINSICRNTEEKNIKILWKITGISISISDEEKKLIKRKKVN